MGAELVLLNEQTNETIIIEKKILHPEDENLTLGNKDIISLETPSIEKRDGKIYAYVLVVELTDKNEEIRYLALTTHDTELFKNNVERRLRELRTQGGKGGIGTSDNLDTTEVQWAWTPLVAIDTIEANPLFMVLPNTADEFKTSA